MRSRSRRLVLGACLAAALTVSACSSPTDAADVTVTSVVTVPPSGGPATTSQAAVSSSPAGSSSVASSSKPPASSSKPPASSTVKSTVSSSRPPGDGSYERPLDGVALPDGYVPKKLKEGEHPPQFVIVSFDGVGWHEKWQYWFDISKQVPFRFTGFLSGTYLLSDETKDNYHPPFYNPGRAEINWNSAADLPTEIADINEALAAGNEIGTHFNGHFCASAGLPSGGDTWNTADWNVELDQFFSMLKNYQANNGITDALNLKASDIIGERTPCLEGTQETLFPALKQHNMIYDSSFTKSGISWPKQSPKYKIWQFGMAIYPIHGTLPDVSEVSPEKRTQHLQITMDYNFWASQRNVTTASPDESKKDSQQVLDTYRDMYNDAFKGNRAPLILGNHFNEWNNNAYSDAIGNFVLETCGKPETQCIPFRDVIAWMLVQDPDRLAGLQAQNPEMGKTAAG